MAYELDNYLVGEILLSRDKDFDPNIQIGGTWQRADIKAFETALPVEAGGLQKTASEHQHGYKMRLTWRGEQFIVKEGMEDGFYDFREDKWAGWKDESFDTQETVLSDDTENQLYAPTYENAYNAATSLATVGIRHFDTQRFYTWRRTA